MERPGSLITFRLLSDRIFFFFLPKVLDQGCTAHSGGMRVNTLTWKLLPSENECRYLSIRFVQIRLNKGKFIVLRYFVPAKRKICPMYPSENPNKLMVFLQIGTALWYGTKESIPCVLIPSCTECVGIAAVLRCRELEALWHVAVDLVASL